MKRLRYWLFVLTLFFRPYFWKQVQKDVEKYKATLKEIDEFLDDEFGNYKKP